MEGDYYEQKYHDEWVKAHPREVEQRKVIEMIESAWRSCPELRLGQLIINAATRLSEVPLFYIEDSNLGGCVAELCQQLNRKNKEGNKQ